MYRHERVAYFIFGLILLGIFAWGTQHIRPTAPVFGVWFWMITNMAIPGIGFIYMAFAKNTWLKRWREESFYARRSILLWW